MMTTTTICDSHTCTRPGCSPDAGYQGHAMRELAPEHFAERAKLLAAEARRFGVVLRIEQQPLLPLAMGNHHDVVSISEVRR